MMPRSPKRGGDKVTKEKDTMMKTLPALPVPYFPHESVNKFRPLLRFERYARDCA
jgi:hypothetical protein